MSEEKEVFFRVHSYLLIGERFTRLEEGGEGSEQLLCRRNVVLNRHDKVIYLRIQLYSTLKSILFGWVHEGNTEE